MFSEKQMLQRYAPFQKNVTEERERFILKTRDDLSHH